MYGVPENLLRKVQSVQNAGACLLTSTRNRDHITPCPVLRQLHWLPVQRRVEFKIACLIHQSLASTAPRRTCLSTFDSPSSMVVLISAHLPTGRAPVSVTEASLLRDLACGTPYRLSTTDDQLWTVWAISESTFI